MEAKAKQFAGDRKAWNIIKHVPGNNTLEDMQKLPLQALDVSITFNSPKTILFLMWYGGIRGTILLTSGKKEEAFRTYSHALGRLATIGGGIGGLMITYAAAPVLLPAVCSVVIGGVAGQLISGGGEIIVDAVTDDELKNGTAEEIEKRVNDKMIKSIPIVGVAYSSVSCGVYLAKGQ